MAKFHTGPASKDTVSGGTKFPLKNERQDNPNISNWGTGSDNIRSKIMSTRASQQGQSPAVESGIKGVKAR